MTAQTIAAFSSISPQLLGAQFYTVTPPVATSGLPVSLSIVSGPATIAGNVISFTGLGTVVLAANQAGNGTYSAAPQVTTSFVVLQVGFNPIKLGTIPAPTVVDPLDFNSIVSQMVADLKTRDPLFTAIVESDPAWKILEVAAYRELLIRQRVNDAAKSVMLPYATGTDLENLASFFGVTRNTVTPADLVSIPNVAAVMEGDDSLRYRTTLALDGLSTAGPTNSYIFHALSCSQVADVSVVGPPTVAAGYVVVTILSAIGSGVATSDLIAQVSAALNASDVRPLTDYVTVQSAIITNFSIVATLTTFSGPDPAIVIANAQASALAYVASKHKIGATVPIAGIISALFVAGVENVVLSSPSADISCDYEHASNCSGISLTWGGIAS